MVGLFNGLPLAARTIVRKWYRAPPDGRSLTKIRYYCTSSTVTRLDWAGTALFIAKRAVGNTSGGSSLVTVSTTPLELHEGFWIHKLKYLELLWDRFLGRSKNSYFGPGRNSYHFHTARVCM